MRFVALSLEQLLTIDFVSYSYEENLATASKFGEKKGIGLGIGMGLFQLVLYSNMALSLWYVGYGYLIKWIWSVYADKLVYAKRLARFRALYVCNSSEAYCSQHFAL